MHCLVQRIAAFSSRHDLPPWLQTDEILGRAGRAAIIELILSTDMKQHFTLVSRIQVVLACNYLAFLTSPHCKHASFWKQSFALLSADLEICGDLDLCTFHIKQLNTSGAAFTSYAIAGIKWVMCAFYAAGSISNWSLQDRQFRPAAIQWYLAGQ